MSVSWGIMNLRDQREDCHGISDIQIQIPERPAVPQAAVDPLQRPRCHSRGGRGQAGHLRHGSCGRRPVQAAASGRSGGGPFARPGPDRGRDPKTTAATGPDLRGQLQRERVLLPRRHHGADRRRSLGSVRGQERHSGQGCEHRRRGLPGRRDRAGGGQARPAVPDAHRQHLRAPGRSTRRGCSRPRTSRPRPATCSRRWPERQA